ncbi:hypothetical protein ACWCXX_34155 [Streptomyces sp. NPDC001732]
MAWSRSPGHRRVPLLATQWPHRRAHPGRAREGARQEHAEQAFLAIVKLKAGGAPVVFSREHHESLHLFNRAVRFLPHGENLDLRRELARRGGESPPPQAQVS